MLNVSERLWGLWREASPCGNAASERVRGPRGEEKNCELSMALRKEERDTESEAFSRGWEAGGKAVRDMEGVEGERMRRDVSGTTGREDEKETGKWEREWSVEEGRGGAVKDDEAISTAAAGNGETGFVCSGPTTELRSEGGGGDTGDEPS
jgi:hypothetical protein